MLNDIEADLFILKDPFPLLIIIKFRPSPITVNQLIYTDLF